MAPKTTSPSATDDTTPSTRLDEARLADGSGLGLELGVGDVVVEPEPIDGAAGEETTGLATPPPLTVGGIPGAAAGAPNSAEGDLTRTIIRCPASQWPATPLTK